MNLHIVPDNVFINKFYDNLRELDIADRNKIVVRTNHNRLKAIRHDFPFAPLYSAKFDTITGDVSTYKNVFIHQFTPLLFRWVVANNFRKLNWMVWGADIYNLPFVTTKLYEPLTQKRYAEGRFSLQNFLYRLKVKILHDKYRKQAYAKIDNVLTWMNSEYDFAIQHIGTLKAAHAFFFYENEVPYQALDEMTSEASAFRADGRPHYIVGNSATAELNHLDAVRLMEELGVKADLSIPLSYGDASYARFLKKSLGFYSGGEVRFIDQYLKFPEYVKFLSSADGLIMNNIRPQGYGNILMMMYLGRQVYLNEKNLSVPELDRGGLLWKSLKNINNNYQPDWQANKLAVTKQLSHELLLKTYANLFD
jgi:dTDP-N-acetylfucosamine:lipid II N-acetylfucosaminyltransferase